MSSPQPLSPLPIMEAASGFQKAAALRAAVDLDLFTHLGAGPLDVAALAQHAGASARGIRILCDYLTVAGFLQKVDGRYRLSPVSAMFLDRNSPRSIASSIRFLTSDTLHEAFRGLTAAVRTGRTHMDGRGSMDPEHPIWIEFARGMVPLMVPAAEAIVKVLQAEPLPVGRVLDVAAGHGIFGIWVAKAYPDARITAVDWTPVLSVAHENAERHGVADRHRGLGGSAFEVHFGHPYDLALVTNFYHHFDRATCVTLARKIYDALAPGGRMVTLEFIPDEDRIHPPGPAQFALTMLASTEHGDAYTFAEYESMFAEAGFTRSVLHSSPEMLNQIVVSYR